MKVHAKRLLSVVCLLAMLLSLVPMSAMAEEVAEVPVFDETDGSAVLMAVNAHNFVTSGAATGFFTSSTSLKSFGDKDTPPTFSVTVDGVTVTGNKAAKPLKMDSKGSCSFTATESGTLTLVLGHKSGETKFKLITDDSTEQVKTFTNNVFTENLAGGHKYTIKQNSGETYLYYISYGSNCEHEVSSWTTVKEPDCIHKGSREGTCGKCGNKVTEEIAATGVHSWSDSEFSIVKAATCTETGIKVAQCTTEGCTAKNDANPITTDALGHQYKNGVDGICQRCGVDSVTGAVHTHEWGEWETVTPATCKQVGLRQRTCTNDACGAIDTEDIPKADHSWNADGVCTVCGAEKGSNEFMKQAGHLESAYIEWAINPDYAGYNVYIQAAGASDWTQLDDQLIRQYPGYMRADALGLKAGNYVMKVVPVKAGAEVNAEAFQTGTLTVLAHDRAGYAFSPLSQHKTGSGAYNDDGTLKTGAIVVYVENKNFDSVQVTVKDAKGNDQTFTGVQAMVDSSGIAKTAPNTPVCIRVLGTIDTTGFPKSSWKSSSEGLQVKGATNYQNKNLTIEGVGNDAVFNGFGMLIRNSGNVEVRNIGLFNFADDGVSVDTNNCNLWVHNCDFFYGGPGGDADQAKGDGSLDSKASTFCTYSYNHFWDSGKCNLQGMKSEKQENRMTYHHNWYDHSDSRHPRIRTCTVHSYNNYFDGNAKYGIGATMNSSVFVENNYFRNCPSPAIIASQGHDIKADGGSVLSGEVGGMIKFYGNTIIGASKWTTYDQDTTNFDAYVAKSRDEKVPASVKAKSGGATYSNFDTASDFYTYQVDTAEAARDKVMAYAGRVEGGDFQWKFDNAKDDTDYSVNAELKAAVTGYKGKLVSVGGTIGEGGSTEHEHSYGPWTVTTPSTCTTYGVETRTCTYPGCGKTETRSAALAAHVYENGVCKNCGHKEGETPVDPVQPGQTPAKELVAKNFKLNAAGKQEDLTAAELAGVAEGYFSLTDGAKNVYKRTKDVTTAGATVEWIQLSQTGTGGIQFTVKAENAPATLSVKFSSTSSSDSKQSSTLVVKDAAGTAVANKEGKTAVTTSKTSKESNAVTSVYENLAAGTYQIFGSAPGTNTVRVYSVSVTETENSGGEDPKPPVHVHSYGDWVVVRPATCGKDGWRERTCSCGEKDGETIEATGLHSWGGWTVTTPATCTEDGEETRTCPVCGEEETQVVPGGHKYVDGVCSVCGKSENTGDDGHTHSWGEYTVVVEPTCVKEGSESRECSVCHETSTRSIPATGVHRYGAWVETREASCTTDGEETRTCFDCGHKETRVIPKTGHTYVDGVCVDCGAKKPGGGNSGGNTSSGGNSGTGTTYVGALTPVVKPSSNGSVSLVPAAAKPGVTVTIKTKPSEGYEVDRITVMDAKGNTVSVTSKGNGEYTFVQPETVATIEASFKTEGSAGSVPDYVDVHDQDWFAAAVDSISAKGLMKGVDETHFAPNATTTRAMVATVLFRLDGERKADGDSKFTDLAGNSWYAEAVDWANQNGVVTGYNETTFGPNDNVTREQLAVMLYRYAKLKGVSVTGSTTLKDFKDADQVSGYAVDAMSWAVRVGIINGRNGDTLAPLGNATRAEVSAMLVRFMNQL